MPKPNKTLLDQLASMMKASGRKKPEIIQATTIRDPLGYTIEQRRTVGKNLDMTPERQFYQKGIDARVNAKMNKADKLVNERYDDLDTFQNEWNDAVDDAKEYMREDWAAGLDDRTFEDVNPYYLEVDAPSMNLRDYWPDYRRTPEEIYEDYDAARDAYNAARNEQRMLQCPESRMPEQMLTPRYRRYQDAMMQRAENARLGRINAAVMNLARQGYSMPEIREILREGR